MQLQKPLRYEPRVEGGPKSQFTFRDVIVAARPQQWTKNSVCLAALIFAGRLGNLDSVFLAILASISFCLASSAIYLFNDIRDREQDRVHPLKRDRPIASGRLGTEPALIASFLMASASIALSLAVGSRFLWVLAIFLTLNVLYTLVLKSLVIIDVMSIAVGFTLRVQAGIEAILAPQSAWILLCMFFMALFLGFGKRRGEITNLKGDRSLHQRPVLQAYSVAYLDVLLGLSATTALVCYSLYAVTVQTNETFLLTIIPVAFGVARYLMLVIVHAGGEGPDEILARDVPLNVAVVVWALLCIAVLYFRLSILPTTHAVLT